MGENPAKVAAPRPPWWVVGLLASALLFELVVRVGAWTLPGDEAAAARFFSPEHIALAHEYLKPRRALGLLWFIVETSIMLMLAVSPWGARLLHALERRAGGPWRTLAAFFALQALIKVVVPIPFLVALRQHARAWGRTAQPHLEWLYEYALSNAVDLAISGAMICVIFAVLRRAPRRGWLASGVVVALGSVLYAWLWPVLVDPLFNEFTPIASTKYAHLEVQLRPLAAASGLADAPIYVMDASRQGGGTNAYVAGLFGTARIVLFDTLLERDDLATLQATFAHEVGHWALGHILRGLMLRIAVTCLGFFLIWRTLAWLVGTTHVAPRSMADPRAFFPMAALVWAAQTLSDPMSCTLSRADEVAADDFGLSLTQAPESWIADERRYVLENYTDPIPHPLRQLTATHPHGVERIARVCAQAPAVCDDVLGQPLAEGTRVTLALDPRDEEAVRQALEPEDAAGDPGSLMLLEDKDRALVQRGLLLYAREWQSGREEAVVARLGHALALSVRAWDGRSGFIHEHVRLGDANDERASLTRRLVPGTIEDVRARACPPTALFSIPQQRFAGDVQWDALRCSAPIQTRQWTARLEDLAVVLERWQLPTGDVLLELSAASTPERADSVRGALDALVKRAGVRRAERSAPMLRAAYAQDSNVLVPEGL